MAQVDGAEVVLARARPVRFRVVRFAFDRERIGFFAVGDRVFVGDVFLVMDRHRRVLDEGVIAAVSGAVEVAVDFVAVTRREATVDVPVVELESFEDFDVVVEVLAVHEQQILSVSNVEASCLVAVIMDRAEVGAQRVGAFARFRVNVESLQVVVGNLKVINTESKRASN